MVTKEKSKRIKEELTMTMEKERAIVVQTQTEKVTITFNDVKRYLCPKASDAEIGLFLKVCQSEGLNPFKREVWLVKYTEDQPAAIIIATETFLKSAESCPEYDGYEAGIILKPIDPKDKPEFREGSFLLDGEDNRLVGGWARVYRKDRGRPFYSAVNIKECIKYTRSGKPTRFWEDMPATMVRKVALSRALREAFSNRYSGTYTTAEIEPPAEGELPPALEKGGQPDWKKFWARAKSELGLTTEQARELLQVDSIKEELIDAGWTMERIWDELVSALQRQKAAAEHNREALGSQEQVVDVQTGEVIEQDEKLFGDEAEEVKPDEAWKEIEREAEATRAEGEKLKRDPETIKTINDLMKACFQDFKLQPKEVVKELGLSSQSDISDTPANCYKQIATIRG